MKRIINGKRYDTAHAERIAEHDFHAQSDTFTYYENLYRTPKGAWFLAGEGGADSKYKGDEGIRVLTAEQAQAWLEARGELEVLERFFHVEDA